MIHPDDMPSMTARVERYNCCLSFLTKAAIAFLLVSYIWDQL